MLSHAPRETSDDPVSRALRSCRRGFWSVALFSSFVNLLMLAGPLYMLQVYDRVLASSSVPTLIGLTVFLVLAYLFQGVLEVIRTRIVVRLAGLIDDQLEAAVHRAVLAPATLRPGQSSQPVREMDQIRAFLLSPGPIAIVDFPWVPVFLLLCFLIHPWLGMTAVVGALVLLVLALLTERASRSVSLVLANESGARALAIEARKRNVESVRAMGMEPALAQRWSDMNRRYVAALQRSSDTTGTFAAGSKIVRLLLQSAMLGVGAYLVIQQEMSAGAMIAASIMMGRALAPVEVAIANWRGFVAARQSVNRLRESLGHLPSLDRIQLPRPRESLEVEGLSVGAPGTRNVVVSKVQFAVKAGEALGVIGPSGSGKTSLARTLIGIWSPLAGSVRLDGAALNQWDPRSLGKHVGYLSQAIDLFDGTIAQNIARLELSPDASAVIAAATTAGAHEMILQMPAGYDTPIGDGGTVLSAGQRQRIGLARALYRDPALVILDEPNSSLDSAGELALLQAVQRVKSRGGMIIVITHKPTLLAVCDKALFLCDGVQKAFGPRDSVVRQVLVQPNSSVTPIGRAANHEQSRGAA